MMLLVRSGLVSTLMVVGSSLSDGSTVASCRVAVCLSGHIRSFVHSAVHTSIRRNLIEAIEADGCDVDIFAYATATDRVPSVKRFRNSEFTPNSTEIEAALALLAPTRTVWHQEQAGVIPNSCSAGRTQAARAAAATTDAATTDAGAGAAAAAAAAVAAADAVEAAPAPPTHTDIGRDSGVGGSWTQWWQGYKDEASVNLYWQLSKSLAAYRMALREEKRTGGDFTYDWIVRARFDVAWVRPLPPLRSFSRDVVWFGAQYWPMSDHFALVPRAFSDRFFATVKGFYKCDGVTWPPSSLWFQPECLGSTFEESVLFRHLHATDIPYRFYSMFEYMVTRSSRGAFCGLEATVYFPVCTALLSWGAFKDTFPGIECVAALEEWAKLRCRALLPGGGLDDAHRTHAVINPDVRAWEALLSTPFPSPSTVLPGEAGGTAPVAVSKVDPELTTVPEMGELDRVRSKLAALRDGLREPTLSFQVSLSPTLPGSGGGYGDGDGGEGRSGPARLFGPDEWRRHPRWESWGESHPPWWVYSPAGCSLQKPQRPGLTPHLILYFTMETVLVEELMQAVKCFSHSLIEGTGWAGEAFDSSFCDDIRPLELVMIDVSHHVKELGVCTADSKLGLSTREHIDRFFREPKKHCVGYGNLEL